MTDEGRRRQVEDICHAALERDAPARAAFIAAACGPDDVLRHEVEALLGHADTAERFLAEPIGGVAARVLNNSQQASPVGRQTGPYKILSLLGSGGMGEVYRARDTTLHRDVALKILPRVFAADPDRLARFRREAQVLASLNHPNIAHVYGLEQADDLQAFVMELVEGPTLADRIAQGPIPIDEALPIARQMADALEAAHEQGIIHRDLKPANVKVRPDGTVKVLDFGLAKALEPASSTHVDATASPTITSPAVMTGGGVLLGTAAYMSPEQARGRAVDKRSDIWAFGCVLYEMLTGQRAFKGDDIADTLAAVLRQEIDWKALPADALAPVRSALQACLQKDPMRRLRDIGDVRLVLDGVFTVAGTMAYTGDDGTHPPAWRRVLPWGAAFLFVSALAGVLASRTPRQAANPAPVRFGIVPPAEQQLALSATGVQVAISPDGTQLVYVATSGALPAGAAGPPTQLMVRSLDRLEAAPLRGISDARAPFFSPDGRWVGFFDAVQRELTKVSMSGGPTITLCSVNGLARGASWAPDNTIVFATSDPTTGLMRVPAGGGDPTVLTKPQDGRDHFFPSVLPGGRAVLFTIFGAEMKSQVAVLDLMTGQQKTLIDGGGSAEYVETGHLVYAAANTLRAVRFDPVRLEVLSDPVPIFENLANSLVGSGGVAQFSVSDNGTLVYLPASQPGTRSIVWVDRDGREEPIGAPPRTYYALRLSPDGQRVALDVRDQENDIWTWSLRGQTLTRITFDPGNDNFPIWTPDGRRIVFNRAQGGLLWQDADGSGAEERMTKAEYTQFAMSFSPDGKGLVVTELKGSNDLSLLSLDGSGRTVPLVQTEFTEGLGEVSPDGRWLAYQSNESGQDEIYVRPFPNVSDGRWQVSSKGGTKPVWARNGRELFFLDGGNALTTVPIQSVSDFRTGKPTKLFDAPYFSAGQGRSYDVSPDGRRFLFIKDIPAPDSSSTSTPTGVLVVLNWFEELKRLVPTP